MLREFGLGHAEDAVCLLHVWSTVTGVVYLQTVVELIQVFLHITDLLLGHVVQAKSYLYIPDEQMKHRHALMLSEYKTSWVEDNTGNVEMTME